MIGARNLYAELEEIKELTRSAKSLSQYRAMLLVLENNMYELSSTLQAEAIVELKKNNPDYAKEDDLNKKRKRLAPVKIEEQTTLKKESDISSDSVTSESPSAVKKGRNKRLKPAKNIQINVLGDDGEITRVENRIKPSRQSNIVIIDVENDDESKVVKVERLETPVSSSTSSLSSLSSVSLMPSLSSSSSSSLASSIVSAFPSAFTSSLLSTSVSSSTFIFSSSNTSSLSLTSNEDEETKEEATSKTREEKNKILAKVLEKKQNDLAKLQATLKTLEEKRDEELEQRAKTEKIIERLMCPVNYEIMRRPMFLGSCCKNNVDFSALQAYLQTGNSSCCILCHKKQPKPMTINDYSENLFAKQYSEEILEPYDTVLKPYEDKIEEIEREISDIRCDLNLLSPDEVQARVNKAIEKIAREESGGIENVRVQQYFLEMAELHKRTDISIDEKNIINFIVNKLAYQFFDKDIATSNQTKDSMSRICHELQNLYVFPMNSLSTRMQILKSMLAGFCPPSSNPPAAQQQPLVRAPNAAMPPPPPPQPARPQDRPDVRSFSPALQRQIQLAALVLEPYLRSIAPQAASPVPVAPRGQSSSGMASSHSYNGLAYSQGQQVLRNNQVNRASGAANVLPSNYSGSSSSNSIAQPSIGGRALSDDSLSPLYPHAIILMNVGRGRGSNAPMPSAGFSASPSVYPHGVASMNVGRGRGSSAPMPSAGFSASSSVYPHGIASMNVGRGRGSSAPMPSAGFSASSSVYPHGVASMNVGRGRGSSAPMPSAEFSASSSVYPHGVASMNGERGRGSSAPMPSAGFSPSSSVYPHGVAAMNVGRGRGSSSPMPSAELSSTTGQSSLNHADSHRSLSYLKEDEVEKEKLDDAHYLTRFLTDLKNNDESLNLKIKNIKIPESKKVRKFLRGMIELASPTGDNITISPALLTSDSLKTKRVALVQLVQGNAEEKGMGENEIIELIEFLINTLAPKRKLFGVYFPWLFQPQTQGGVGLDINYKLSNMELVPMVVYAKRHYKLAKKGAHLGKTGLLPLDPDINPTLLLFLALNVQAAGAFPRSIFSLPFLRNNSGWMNVQRLYERYPFYFKSTIVSCLKYYDIFRPSEEVVSASVSSSSSSSSSHSTVSDDKTLAPSAPSSYSLPSSQNPLSWIVLPSLPASTGATLFSLKSPIVMSNLQTPDIALMNSSPSASSSAVIGSLLGTHSQPIGTFTFSPPVRDVQTSSHTGTTPLGAPTLAASSSSSAFFSSVSARRRPLSAVQGTTMAAGSSASSVVDSRYTSKGV